MVKKGLGKGLGALIPSQTGERITTKYNKEELYHIPLDKIISNPNQPRKEFSEEKIDELAQSVKENGLIQPIVVRKSGETYQIIAGERRFRACKRLSMEAIPAIIKDYDDNKTSRVALIENIQRQDLTPVEEAMAYKQLITDHHLKQAELGEILGKSRSAITNALRLLELPREVLEMLNEETLYMGHARALLALPEKKIMILLAHEIAQKGLSVRETEKRVKKLLEQPKIEIVKKHENVELSRIKENLEVTLATKVNIKGSEKNGRIEISYFSLDDLNRILEILESR